MQDINLNLKVSTSFRITPEEELRSFWTKNTNIILFPSTAIFFSVCLASITFKNPQGTHLRLLLGSICIPTNADRNLPRELDRLYAVANTFDAIILGGDFNTRHQHWGDRVHNGNGLKFYDWFFNGPFLNLDLIPPNSPTFPL